MNLIWLTIATTSLDTKVANILEVAVALQQDGVITKRRSWKIRPLLYSDDVIFGQHDYKTLVNNYRNRYPTQDPALRLELFTKDEQPLFFYTPDTLQYLGIKDPETLLYVEGAVDTLDFIDEFLKFVALQPKQFRWVLAGHNVKFLSSVLAAYMARVGKEASDSFDKVICVDNAVDTVPFFRVVNSFHNNRSVTLPRLAEAYGLELGSSAELKLDVLLNLVEAVIKRRSDVQFTSSALSP